MLIVFTAVRLKIILTSRCTHQTYAIRVLTARMDLRKAKKDLNDDEMLALHSFLLEKTTCKKLEQGTLSEAAEKFNVSLSAVKRIRSMSLKQTDHLDLVKVLKKKYKGTEGRKHIDKTMLQAKVRQSHIKIRGTFDSLSSATGISASTLFRALKRSDLASEGRKFHSYVTIKNRINRVKWCLSHVDRHLASLPFSSMHNKVHIDEKWFY